jgi:hypothetical protein
MSAAEFQRRHGRGKGSANGASKPQIRIPKQSEPNKTEAAWIARLQVEYPAPRYRVLYEPFTLRLHCGTKYTPDVVVVEWRNTLPVILVSEVKGKHIHSRDSIEKFKQAVAEFRHYRFCFAQLRGTTWAVEYANEEAKS